MRVTILGSGTSSGVPMPGCRCTVCTSGNPRNQRLRTSAFIELFWGADIPHPPQTPEPGESFNILIDCTPDLRQQALRVGISRIDAVLFTHSHADHIFGLDDLRSFNFIQGSSIPLYADSVSAAEIERIFRYALEPDETYEGGTVPQITLTRIEPYLRFTLGGVEILPLFAKHGSSSVLGYRIKNFAYLTDCSLLPDRTRELLEGVDTLVLDGLRRRPHKTHFTHDKAVAEIERLKPKQAYLIHLSHEVDYEEGNRYLRSITQLPVELAYDGLVITG